MVEGMWLEALQGEFKKEYYKKLYNFVHEEYRTHTIYPPAEDIFNALKYTPLDKVKVLILGQDPYHNVGQAHGLSFSVRRGIEIPPSLKNIYEELKNDLGYEIPKHGCLESWAKEGVLLLNTVLTVRAHQAFSHRDKGWEEFTDAIIRRLNEENRPMVHILWGSSAAKKEKMLTHPKHLIVKAPHPSPLSAYRGFFGSKPFSKTNAFLLEHGEKPIDWRIVD